MNKLSFLALFLILTNASTTILRDSSEEYELSTEAPTEQALPLASVSDEQIMEFASTIPEDIKLRVLAKGKEEMGSFLNQLLNGEKVTSLAFGKHQMRVSADGSGLDVLLELKVNKVIDIEVQCLISKVTGTFTITGLIANCPPFKTFEELEIN